MFFFFNDTATTEIYTLSLHDALPILDPAPRGRGDVGGGGARLLPGADRSPEGPALHPVRGRIPHDRHRQGPEVHDAPDGGGATRPEARRDRVGDRGRRKAGPAGGSSGAQTATAGSPQPSPNRAFSSSKEISSPAIALAATVGGLASQSWPGPPRPGKFRLMALTVTCSERVEVPGPQFAQAPQAGCRMVAPTRAKALR